LIAHSNIALNLDNSKLTEEFLVGLAPHILRATGVSLIDTKLAGNFINTSSRPVHPAPVLAVVVELAAFTRTETASVLVELANATSAARADQVGCASGS
jgi:hypothetical protein